MTTALQFAEDIARLKGGGINTEEAAENSILYWLSIGNSLRETVFNSVFEKTKKIDRAFYQTTELNVMEYDKSKCLYVTEPIPQITSVLSFGDAINLVRPENTLCGKFRAIENYGELTDMLSRNFSRKTINRYFVDLSLAQGLVLYMPKYKTDKIHLTAVFSEPEKVKGFNIEKDNYPMPQGFMPMIKDYVGRQELRFGIIKDKISNSKNDIENAARGNR